MKKIGCRIEYLLSSYSKEIQKNYKTQKCPVLKMTHSIFYKKNCTTNRFCVIVAYSCPDLAVLKFE